MNGIYEKILFYFNDNIYINYKIDLMLKIVSYGDLLLIQSFVSEMHKLYKSLEQEKDKNKKFFIQNEIFDNYNLLHWLLETSFQIFILLNQDKSKNNESFISGFSLDIYKDSNTFHQLELLYDEKKKKIIFEDIYWKNKKNLINIICN